MKHWSRSPLLIGIGIAVAFGSLCVGMRDAASTALPAPDGFIQNRGQVDSRVLFYAVVGNSTVYCTRDGLVIDRCEMSRMSQDPSGSRLEAMEEPVLHRQGRVIRVHFENANPAPRIEGEQVRAVRMNFFFGKDPALWRSGVPVYGRVVYRNLWPGIDLGYEPSTGRITCVATVAPDANPSVIAFRSEGAESPDTILGPNGTVHLTRFGHAAAPVDPVLTKTSNRDPHLLWSTFLGSTAEEIGWSIALDSEARPVVTGVTFSSHFPTTTGAYDQTYNGYGDVFVSKLSADGSTLLWSTFLGGTSVSGFDYGYSIDVDASGSPFVTGYTWSEDFPVTNGAYDTIENGFADAFVTKLDAGGGFLQWSTFLGGETHDIGYAVHLDSEGNPIVAGRTLSVTFPTTVGAYDETPNGEEDGFVTAISSTGDRLLWSTYLGGSLYDGVSGVGIDRDGSPLVVGYTASPDFPGGSGMIGGLYDVFVSKLSPLGNALLWSRVIGGGNYDYANDLALDSSGDPIVCGATGSPDFPVTAGAYDESYNGDDDAFLMKLSGADGATLWSTFIGGTTPVYETAFGVAVNAAGEPVIVGSTPSSDFPVTQDAYDASYNGLSDVFVSRFDAAGSSLAWSTFLGGPGDDYGWYLALDPEGRATVVGVAGADGFPTTPGAYDTSYNGDISDVFVAKLAVETNPAAVAESKPVEGARLRIHPNPLGRDARLTLSLPIASNVRIDLIDPAGRRLRQLVNGPLGAGEQSIPWDGRDATGRLLPGGRYFLRIVGEGIREVRPITIVR